MIVYELALIKTKKLCEFSAEERCSILKGIADDDDDDMKQ